VSSRVGVLAACAAAVVYLVLVGRQLGRPLMYDDANFALAARAVAETGLPFGNQGWMSERGDFSQREQWALWHPPLYVYADGLAARIGGWTPPVLRVLGVAGGLATAGLTYALAADLTHGPAALKNLAGALAAALVLVCPLVVQSTLVLDIDFPLLLPLTLLFALVYLRLEASRRAWLWLAPLFALLLWSKMTNPVALVGVAVVWQLLHGPRRFARAGLHLIGIGLGGAAVFGVSWLVIGRWLSFPLDMPFGVNQVQWQDSADVARRAYTSPGAFIEGLQPSVLWLGPGLVALGLIGVAVRGGQLVRCWRLRHADLLIGVLAAFVLGYVNKSAGWFPKYQVALAPFLACLAAPVIARAWYERPRLASGVSLVVLIAAAVISVDTVRDDWALQRTWAIDPTPGAWLLALAVVGTLVGLPWRATASTACAALVGLALGWSLGTDVYQQNASYTTDYWYGTRGTAEAAVWLDTHLVPEQTYVAAKEVAIRSQDQRYVDQDNIVYFLSTGRGFDGTWAGEPLKALVTWQREPYVADLFGRALPAAGFRETARFGDYVVYEPASG
jgi:4-amino-4-deoxy-L-arabinose transferase-like glycosyltransferase